MARFKATAFVDGAEKEIELDDEKFIPVDQHKLRLEHTVQERLDRQKRSLREELEKDEEFFTTLAKRRGFDPSKKGKPDAEEITRAQEQWRASELTPIQQQLTEAEQRIERMRARTLVADLTNALVAAGVKKSVAPRIAQLEAQRFGFDDKTETFGVRTADGKGFEFATKATTAAPYKGIDEFAAEWVGNKENADFLEDTRQRGPSVGGTGGDGPRSSVRTKADLKTDADKVAFIGEHGYAKYIALPDK